MYENLPALVVVVPLVGAPICMLIRYRGWSWAIALICTWISFFLSYLLLRQVMDAGVVSYALGGWAAPLGIEYRIDAANAFVLLIVSAIGSVIMPFARESVRSEFGRQQL